MAQVNQFGTHLIANASRVTMNLTEPAADDVEGKKRYSEEYNAAIGNLLLEIVKLGETYVFHGGKLIRRTCHRDSAKPFVILDISVTFLDKSTFANSFAIRKSDCYMFAFTSNGVWKLLKEFHNGKLVEEFKNLNPDYMLNLRYLNKRKGMCIGGALFFEVIRYFSKGAKDDADGQIRIERLFYMICEAVRFPPILLEVLRACVEAGWDDRVPVSEKNSLYAGKWDKLSSCIKKGVLNGPNKDLEILVDEGVVDKFDTALLMVAVLTMG